MKDFSGINLKGYELKERIGSGGMGAVYRAYQSTIGREVAVKIILPGYANQPEFIRRFESEAQLVARLEHPYIVPLYDYWRDPQGAYLVMRYLRGGSLADLIQRDPLPIETTTTILDQIASALTVAHRNNVIHRDIKPGNILIDDDGNAYLSDFGIAKELQKVQTAQTDADKLMGSPEYLSPEQARTEPVSPQTDIYSLGVVVYEMLTGEHPFPGRSAVEKLFAHITNPLPEITALDPAIQDAINTVIGKATIKDPAKRYDSVTEFAAAFRTAAALSASRVDVDPVELLTPREQEVLKYVIQGHSNREIADKLTVEIGTVKWHLNQLYKKLNVRSRVQAVVKARELNLIVEDFERWDTRAITSISSIPEPDNPYKGLQAFQVADEVDFFGRERMVKKLLKRLGEKHKLSHFLTVVGPSGSGKSSLVKAGLIPALWRGELDGSDNWYIVEMMPNDRPLDELEVALNRIVSDQTVNLNEQLHRDEKGLVRLAGLILPDDGSELLLIIDQFEELFTLVNDEAVRQHFLDLLYTAVTASRSRVRIVVTLRADFYDRPLHYPRFGGLVRERMETVLPLGAQELEQAIVKPAERVGVTYEEGLVATIVSDVNYQPGTLPLLQYALTELFERREGLVLASESYQHIGRSTGALAKRAEDTYQELGSEYQETVRQMFLRLVTLGEGSDDTRRRVNRRELLEVSDDPDIMDEVIDTFASYRLLSLDHDPATRRPTVEVAHEALLREWNRLGEWLNTNRADIHLQRLLARAAQEWAAADRDPGFLVPGGTRLDQFQTLSETTELAFTPMERDFIHASLEAEQQRQSREMQQQRTRRNLQQALIGALSIGLIISIVLTVIALTARNQAVTSAGQFRSVALINGAQQQLLDGSPDMALALATEAMDMSNPPFTSQLGFIQLAHSSWIKHRIYASDAQVFGAAYLPDGQRIVITSWDGYTTLWDLESGEMLDMLERGGEGRPTFVGVHPEDDLVVIAGFAPFLQLWDLERGEVTTLEGNGPPVFNSNGTKLAVGHFGNVNIYDTTTWDVILSFEAHDTFFLNSIAFSPDESLIITGAEDGQVKIWDGETGEHLKTIFQPSPSLDRTTLSRVWAAQILPDQEHLITAGNYGTMLWEWQSETLIWHEPGPAGGATAQDMELVLDGHAFLVGYNEPEPVVELRSVETGRLLHVYRGHSLRVQDIDINPDGLHFLTGSNDGTAIAWPIQWEGFQQSIFVHSTASIAAHPSRPLVAVVGVASAFEVDSTIRLVDTTTGQIVQEFIGHQQSVRGLTFTPDGQRLWSSDIAGVVKIWDVETGDELMTFTSGDGSSTFDIAITPDGQVVALPTGLNSTIILRDQTTGEKIGELEGHLDEVEKVIFSRDGQYLFSAGRDGSLFQWDWQSGEIVRELEGHDVSIASVNVSSNGQWLISASSDRTARVWDIQSGDRIFTLEGHSDLVTNAAFSPDDTIIMTASLDGSINLWDAQSGDFLRTYTVSSDPNWLWAIFSQDGQTIISAANDVLTLWDASPLPGGLLNWVKENRFIPDFTCDQRELYQIEPFCDNVIP